MPTHVKSEIMQHIDKGDKPLLTFFLSTSDDKKFIQIINHSTKTTASHLAKNSIRDTVENEWWWCNNYTGKSRVCQTSSENLVTRGEGGNPGSSTKQIRYQLSSKNNKV